MPAAKHAFSILLHRVRGHGDDVRLAFVGNALADGPCRLQAIHLRHLQIHQHQIIWLPLDGFDRLESGGRQVSR